MEILIDSPRLEITYITSSGKVIILDNKLIEKFRNNKLSYSFYWLKNSEFYIEYGCFDFIVKEGIKLHNFLNQINKPIYN